MGFGSLALASMLHSCGLGSSTNNNIVLDPTSVRAETTYMFPDKGKRILFYITAGAPSIGTV